MRILGCDLHAAQQSIAMLDCETGEVIKKTLHHQDAEVRGLLQSAAGAGRRRSPRAPPTGVSPSARPRLRPSLGRSDEITVTCLCGSVIVLVVNFDDGGSWSVSGETSLPQRVGRVRRARPPLLDVLD